MPLRAISVQSKGFDRFRDNFGTSFPLLTCGAERTVISLGFLLPPDAKNRVWTRRTHRRFGRRFLLPPDLPTLRNMASLSSTAQCSVTSAADDEVSKVCIFGDLRSRVCGDLRFEINVHPISFVGGWLWHCAV